MTKERREEFRTFLREQFTELLDDWVTYVGDDEEPRFAVYVDELRALLDSDERLEAVREWAATRTTEQPSSDLCGDEDECHYYWAQAEVREILTAENSVPVASP